MKILTIEDVLERGSFSLNPIINDIFASRTIKKGKIVDIKLTAQIMHSPVVNYI